MKGNLTDKELNILIRENKFHQCEGIGKERICVTIEAVADLPTRYGHFKIVAFYDRKNKKEHVALVHGNVIDKEDVVVRLHSECLTGDVFGSMRCDCNSQLTAALEVIGRCKRGLLIYLRQEGRGIGLLNKIKAYALQEQGLDTGEANIALGFKDDEREYSVAAHIIKSLKIRSIRLMTNNPHKIAELKQYGIKITQRIPLVVPPNKYNKSYLETKKRRFGHLLGNILDSMCEQGEDILFKVKKAE